MTNKGARQSEEGTPQLGMPAVQASERTQRQIGHRRRLQNSRPATMETSAVQERSAFEEDREEEKKEEEPTQPHYELIDDAGNNMLSEAEAGPEQIASDGDEGTPVARTQQQIAEEARAYAVVRATVERDNSP